MLVISYASPSSDSLFLDVSISPSGEVKLGVGEHQTFVVVVSGGVEPYSFLWKSNGTRIGTGQTLDFVFDSVCDYVTLVVEVTDSRDNFGYAVKTVYDPYTSSDVYLNSFAMPYSYLIETDGLGWYRAISGETGEICWESTNYTYVLQNAIDILDDDIGGEMRHTSGVFNLIAPITIYDQKGVTISGAGKLTKITQADNMNLTRFFDLDGSGLFFTLKNIYLDGNRVNNVNTNGVEVQSGNSASYVWIENCRIQYFPNSCIMQRGNIWNVKNSYITEAYGSQTIFVSGSHSIYEGNQIGGAGGTGGRAFRTSTAGYIKLIGNDIFGATDYIIYLDSAIGCEIIGNRIGGDAPTAQYDAIYMTCSSASYGKFNIISNNVIHDIDRDGIRIAGAESKSNIISDNQFRNIGNQYIIEYTAGVDNNTINGNILTYDNAANKITILGALTQVYGNVGFVTENQGTQTCANNEDIVHGLSGTPTSIQVDSMNATYDSVPVLVNIDWSGVDSTNINMGIYWTNGTAITDDTILVSWSAKYEP